MYRCTVCFRAVTVTVPSLSRLAKPAMPPQPEEWNDSAMLGDTRSGVTLDESGKFTTIFSLSSSAFWDFCFLRRKPKNSAAFSLSHDPALRWLIVNDDWNTKPQTRRRGFHPLDTEDLVASVSNDTSG